MPPQNRLLLTIPGDRWWSISLQAKGLDVLDYHCYIPWWRIETLDVLKNLFSITLYLNWIPSHSSCLACTKPSLIAARFELEMNSIGIAKVGSVYLDYLVQQCQYQPYQNDYWNQHSCWDLSHLVVEVSSSDEGSQIGFWSLRKADLFTFPME